MHLESLAQTCGYLTEKLKHAENELAFATRENHNLRDSNESLKQRNFDLEEENSALVGENKELKAKLNSANRDIHDNMKSYRELQNEQFALIAENAKLKSEIQRLENKTKENE